MHLLVPVHILDLNLVIESHLASCLDARLSSCKHDSRTFLVSGMIRLAVYLTHDILSLLGACDTAQAACDIPCLPCLGNFKARSSSTPCCDMIGRWRAVVHPATVPGECHSLQHRYRKGRSALQVVSMAHMDAGFFVNGRNQKLRTVEYLPDQQTRPKAIIFFHHGYGEHISRYEKGEYCSPLPAPT